MKRILSAIAVCAVLTASFSACTVSVSSDFSSSTDNAASSAADAATTVAETTTEAPAAETTEAAATEAAADNAEPATDAATEEATEAAPSLDDQATKLKNVVNSVLTDWDAQGNSTYTDGNQNAVISSASSTNISDEAQFKKDMSNYWADMDKYSYVVVIENGTVKTASVAEGMDSPAATFPQGEYSGMTINDIINAQS